MTTNLLILTFIDKKKMTIVVFCGAGISALSGIPTFRDSSNGLWKRFDPNRVCHIDNVDSDESIEFFKWFRTLVEQSEPNVNHYWLAELQQSTGCKIYTSNIDNLLERAGCNVEHVHGDIYSRVVMFGEKGDYENLFSDIIDLKEGDTLLVIGASMKIIYLDLLTTHVRCNKIWVNPDEGPKHFNIFFQNPMEECLEELSKLV
jgi:NAD-dependent SIR2 family protein deacetylase